MNREKTPEELQKFREYERQRLRRWRQEHKEKYKHTISSIDKNIKKLYKHALSNIIKNIKQLGQLTRKNTTKRIKIKLRLRHQKSLIVTYAVVNIHECINQHMQNQLNIEKH